VFAFKQEICGFDLLRSGGKSYVCDVNGWAFVKSNEKHYSDCAILIRKLLLGRYQPSILSMKPMDIGYNPEQSNEKSFRPRSESDLINKSSDAPRKKKGPNWELRSVCAIFRHGDRKPKMKMKMITDHELFLQFINMNNRDPTEIKLKS
jgi:inositol-hexakisphosphate/diphosphoinositol-pentakisphosphate 1-kinase